MTTGSTIATEADTAEEVGKNFFAAWAGGNDTVLATTGTTAAINAAKAGRADGTSSFRFSNCQGAAGTIFCTFVRRGQRVVLGVDNVDVPHRVDQFKRDDLDAQTVAQEFLNAWQGGSADAVAALSDPAAAASATALRVHAGLPWSLDNCQGAAGSIFCTFKAGTSKLVVRVVQVNPPPIVGDVQYTP
jgi:hypothetical protein